MENKKKLNDVIKYERDFNFDYFGYKTLEKAYLLRINKVIIEISNIANPLSLELLVKQLSYITGFNINNILEAIKINKTKKKSIQKKYQTRYIKN